MAIEISESSAGFSLKNNKKIYLVEERLNPSTDYFIVPFLDPLSNIIRCSFSEIPLSDDLEGAIVIFVRYLPGSWVKLISENRSRIRHLIFFMDDDLFDISVSVKMPIHYRYKLFRYAFVRKKWLKSQGAELWVSTNHLAKKYADWSPKVITPRPLRMSEKIRKFFYHGSASHNAEIKWLRPVVEEVLHLEDSFFFEIIGGKEVFRAYKDLPRTTVVHPLKWPAYKSFLAMPGRHVGLAPQLDTPFNRARSYTKFFDITQSGAVGIYSLGSECATVVDDDVDGRVVPLKPQAWVAAIADLLGNEQKRLKQLAQAEQKLLKLSDKP